MKVEIPEKMSGNLKDFTDIYNKKFLEKNGLKIHVRGGLNIVPIDGLTVVADKNTIFTYLGKSRWEVGVKK